MRAKNPYRLFDPQDDYQRRNEKSTRVISDVPNSFTDYRVRSPPRGEKEKRKEKKRKEKINKSTKGKFKSPLWERSAVLQDRQTDSQSNRRFLKIRERLHVCAERPRTRYLWIGEYVSLT